MHYFGQKTATYSLGYGYCQCGCKKKTQTASNGIFKRFMVGHDGVPPLPEQIPDKRRLPNLYPDKELIERYLDLVANHEQLKIEFELSREEIRFVLKLINDFWRGSDEGKQLVIEKLHLALGKKRAEGELPFPKRRK